MDDRPSYHDLHVTTAEIPRTSIARLPFGVEVSCNRTAGWCVWRNRDSLVASEYGRPDQWLVLDVAGHVILDSRGAQA